MKNINEILEKELATFDRSIVATPQDRGYGTMLG